MLVLVQVKQLRCARIFSQPKQSGILLGYCLHVAVRSSDSVFVFRCSLQEEDAVLAEMEFTGQAFEEMQEQNVRLLQQLREKDDANLKLMSEVGTISRVLFPLKTLMCLSFKRSQNQTVNRKGRS